MTGVRVRARLFARLREQAGTAVAELELPAGATVADAYAALRAAHPGLEPDRSRLRPALNEEFAEWDARLGPGDEVSFIPPVSGGSGVLIEVTDDVLDPRRLEAVVEHPGAGALCTFSGIVRDNNRGQGVSHLEYEAYGEMAHRQMAAIAAEIGARWPEARVAMAHRTGRLEIGEASVVVCVSAPHRADAIDACRWGIDRLKESVPIWKKEHTRSGAVWLEGPDAHQAGDGPSA